MPEPIGEPLAQRFERIAAALGAPGAPAQREALKGEIVALYRAIDQEVLALGALKDRVKDLVQAWKGLGGGSDGVHASVPAPVPSGAATLRADHLNASTFLERGWSLMALGDPAAAEAAFAEALALVPDDANAEALLGWARMLQEKYDLALETFGRVLARHPQHALARINVGFIRLKQRRFDEAVDHLSRAIRLDNDRKATLYAHYYLGLLYLERERYDEAEHFLQRAIALGPNLVEAYFELGRARQLAGDLPGAVAAWREGARANKFSPWGTRCAEMVEHAERSAGG